MAQMIGAAFTVLAVLIIALTIIIGDIDDLP